MRNSLAFILLLSLFGCGGGGSSSGTTGGQSSGTGPVNNGNPANNNNPVVNPPVSTRVLELVNKPFSVSPRASSQVLPLVDNSAFPGRQPQISSDGRFVAFLSEAADLVTGDTNLGEDVFVRDRVSATSTRANLLDAAAQTPAAVAEYFFSENYQWLGFWCTSNTPPPNWYLKNVLTNQSYSGTGFATGVSPDGSKIAFWTPGTPALLHYFDRLTNQTIDIAPTANGSSLAGRFSRDGSLLYFMSEATNLVPGDTNGVSDLFTYRLSDGLISRFSVLPGGGQMNGLTGTGRESANSRYYVFSSEASNIVSGDTNGVTDVFVKDTQTGQITLVSRARSGPANGDSGFASISDDGRLICFNSTASNLVERDNNGIDDVFLFNRETNTLLGRVSLTENLREASGQIGTQRNAEISGDGKWIAFCSAATNMLADVRGGNVFLTNAEVPQLFTPPGPHPNTLQYTLTGNANIDMSPFSGAGAHTVTGSFYPEPNQASGLQARVSVVTGANNRLLDLSLLFGHRLAVGDQITLPDSNGSVLNYTQSPTNSIGPGYGYSSGTSGTLTVVSFDPATRTIGLRLDDWQMVSNSGSAATGSFVLNGTLTLTLP